MARGLVVLGVGGVASACSSASTAPPVPSPSPTIAPPSATALHAVAEAADRTLQQTAVVSVDLAGARIFGTAGPPVLGTGAFDFRGEKGRVLLHQPSGDETVIFEPASVLVRQPPSTAGGLPRGKHWISAGLIESATLTANYPQFVVQAEGTNPAFLLNQVAWGAVSAAPLESGPVNGAETRGYLVDVDLGRAASGATGPSGAAFARAIGYELTAAGAVGAGATRTENVRVWIDPDGRMVQLQASPPASGVGVTTMSFSSFGVAVRVVVPPKAQIVDVASLSPGGERENNGGGDSDGA
jgi:hypothetical protein